MSDPSCETGVCWGEKLSDKKRMTLIACGLLVVLRIAIGWQFLYEGLWKISTQSGPRPWTSAGYLQNSQGPFRGLFRSLIGDADQQNWLDAEWVAARWDNWQRGFVDRHALDKNQQNRLDRLLNGPKDFRAVLKTLPPEVEFRGTLGKRLKFDEKRGRLIVDGKAHLTPRERDAALKLVRIVKDPAKDAREANEQAQEYQSAVRTVFARASRLSFKERLRASLLGDPDRVGTVIKERGSNEVLETRLGEIELYRKQLQRYEEDLQSAETGFHFEHVKKLAVPGYGNTNEIRSGLIGPIKSLESELIQSAEKLLTAPQRARGVASMPATRVQQLDVVTMWTLAGLGVLLIAGLCSRVAAMGAAGMLLMFYLAMPPWPGVPPVPGPDHSLWINKNLIEVLALLAIASLPTGRWFGVDALIGRLPLKVTGKPAVNLADEPKTSPATASGQVVPDVEVAETITSEHEASSVAKPATGEKPVE